MIKIHMHFYKIYRKFFGIKNHRIKLLGIVAVHIAKMRYIGVFIDPIIACNIRCKMCYFSDENNAPKFQKPITEEKIEFISNALFHRAAKVQIGCGAEPTMYKNLPYLIKRCKSVGIPYIEITTNGQLLDYEKLKVLVENGLDGMTLSLHGTSKSTYEDLMEKANFEKLTTLIVEIGKIQQNNPKFTLRVNYTFNNQNVDELRDIWQLFGNTRIDVLQIRPIQNMGETKYNDFDLKNIINNYDTLIQPLFDYSKAHNITLIGPTVENLKNVNKLQNIYDKIIEDITYCYISPTSCYKSDFDLVNDSFESYHKRKKLIRKLMSMIFSSTKRTKSVVNKSKKLNYKIT